MYPDYEYMLTNATGLEEILFSSNKLRNIAKFCNIPYSSIRTYASKKSVFYFENKLVRIETIDMNKNYF